MVINTVMETNYQDYFQQPTSTSNFEYYNELQSVSRPEFFESPYRRFLPYQNVQNQNTPNNSYYYSCFSPICTSNLPPINSFSMTGVPPINSPTPTITSHIPSSNRSPLPYVYTNISNTTRNLLLSAAGTELQAESNSKNYNSYFHDEHEVSTTNNSYIGSKSNKRRPLRILPKTIPECSNCKTQNTPLWRRLAHSRKLACNACGLHHKKYNEDRPLSRCKQDGFMPRKRKSKSQVVNFAKNSV